MRARDLGFLVRADRADHGNAERLRPLAGDQAHAARRRVVEDRFATFKRVNLSEQILRRHPLHHQGRRSAVRDTVRQGNQNVRGHDTDVRIGALWPQQVADTVTYPNVVNPRTYGLDHTHRIRAQAVRQWQRVAAGAKINVDEVDGDVGVSHARLAGPWLAHLRGLELEDLRSSGLVKADGTGHIDLSLNCARWIVTQRRSFNQFGNERIGARPVTVAGCWIEMSDFAEIDELLPQSRA